MRACRLCEPHLPLGAKPVLRAGTSARLLIVGQAPGTKVHATGIPWNDASGNRLRQWRAIDRDTFHDENIVAIVPMGFCYPGKGKGGDLPPRSECAPTWHPKILPLLPNIRLILLIGSYAQSAFLGATRHSTLTGTVRAAKDYLPRYLPLPHPSPRNQMWLRRNPWFEQDIVPLLRGHVAAALAAPSPFVASMREQQGR
ncbi:MAG TPA: uracil-DNA glycosylase family protein [Xanthomonadaceae bacterium]